MVLFSYSFYIIDLFFRILTILSLLFLLFLYYFYYLAVVDIKCGLPNLGCKVLEDGRAVHGGRGPDTAVAGGAALEVAVDPASKKQFSIFEFRKQNFHV